MIWFPISIFIFSVSSPFSATFFSFLFVFSPFRTKVAPCHPIRQPKPVNIIYAVVFIYVKCQQDCKLKRRLYRSSGPVCVFPPLAADRFSIGVMRLRWPPHVALAMVDLLLRLCGRRLD